MEYKNEEEFLREYDSSIFEKPSVTVDIVTFSVSSKEKENYRKLTKKKMSVLLVKRNTYPFYGKWCLPGGFLKMEESLDEGAIRILADETNLHDIYLEQLYTFGKVDRDPRMRIISTTYVALIDKEKHAEKLTEHASWFDISLEESKDEVKITLNNEKEKIFFRLKKVLREKTTDRYEFIEIENDYIAFDHAIVILSGLERIKNKLEYTDIVFNIMPEEFTLGELQQVYEVILRKKLLDPAFRRIIGNKVVKTNKYKTGGGHRPSVLFKMKDK